MRVLIDSKSVNNGEGYADGASRIGWEATLLVTVYDLWEE
jgi:hypothetical protein